MADQTVDINQIITGYVTQVEANFTALEAGITKVSTGITTLDTLIRQFQSQIGTTVLSPNTVQLLNQLVAHSAGLVTEVNAIDTSAPTPPVVVPPDTIQQA